MRFNYLVVPMCLLAFYSCQDDMDLDARKPSGIKKGNVWEILEKRGDFSLFLEAARRAGYQELYQGKGLSTVFAVENSLFQKYLTEKGYSSLDAVPDEELRLLIGQHTLMYSYPKHTLMDFQPQNGMAELPGLNFRHRTIVRDSIYEEFDPVTQKPKKVFNVQKFLPVITSNLFNSLELKDAEENYKYFYPNSKWYGNGTFSVANAGVLEYDIPTDNGFLHIVDQVIKPMRTVYKVMKDENLAYGQMKELYNRFNDFQYQAGYSQQYGKPGDSLFVHFHRNTQDYPILNIASEMTYHIDIWEAFLYRDSYNAFVPNDAAMETFFNSYWGNKAEVPVSDMYKSYDELDLLSAYYLVENHFQRSSLAFPERFRTQTMRNSWGYVYDIDVDTDVEYKEVCGNGSFLGLTKVDVPQIFTGITGPVFQSKKYRLFSHMLAIGKLLPDLANNEAERTMFILSDNTLKEAGYWLDEKNIHNLQDDEVKQNTSGINAANVKAFINNYIINQRIDPEIIESENGVWMESAQSGFYMNIGQNRIKAEDGSEAQIGDTYQSKDGSPWLVYELRSLLSKAVMKPFIEHMEPSGGATPPAYNWVKTLKESFIKQCDHFTGDNKPLKAFATQRGVFFCPVDNARSAPGGWVAAKTNGVPASPNSLPAAERPEAKKVLSKWFDRYFISKNVNPALFLPDFLSGTIKDTYLVTMDPEFIIEIVEMEPNPDNQYAEYGEFRVRIRLPESENNREVFAYGPNSTNDCVYFMVPEANNRFEWGEVSSTN
ncbi:MAG: fasciclin domain-containing protein [Bacteroidales bacterium]